MGLAMRHLSEPFDSPASVCPLCGFEASRLCFRCPWAVKGQGNEKPPSRQAAKKAATVAPFASARRICDVRMQISPLSTLAGAQGGAGSGDQREKWLHANRRRG
jgi:hypothetical protein